MFQINGDFLKGQSNFSFSTEDFVSFLHFPKNCNFSSERFLKHPHFTAFLLVFVVDQVSNISNEYRHYYKSERYQMIHVFQ